MSSTIRETLRENMDDYLDQLLASFSGPPALRTIIQKILDEPIPEATKRRLLKPLLPRPVPPVRKHRGVKRKALLAEFDPLLFKKDRGGPPLFLLHEEFTNQLRDYRVDVPHGHGLEGDALTFLSAMQPGIEVQLNEQLIRQHGVKYITSV